MTELLKEDEPETAIARAIATNYLPMEQGEVRYGTPPKPSWSTPPRETLTPPRPKTAARVTWADRTPTRPQQTSEHRRQPADSNPIHHQQQPLGGELAERQQQRQPAESDPPSTGVELAEKQWGSRMATFRHTTEAFKERVYQAGKQAVREHQLEHERNNRARDIAHQQAREQAARSAPTTTSKSRWWKGGLWSRHRR